MDYKYTIEYLQEIKSRCLKIQNKYEFKIPEYILTEIAEENYDRMNLCLLINMAIINNRLTSEEGKILKTEYCFH